LLAVFLGAHLDVAGAQAVFLAAGDEPLRLLGREALVVDVVLLHQPLDGRQLVLRVQDLEALRQVGQLVVRAQEAVAQAVEGADPHAAHVDGQHRRQPRHHFLGGLVGEGHGHDVAGADLAGGSSQAMRVVSTRVLPEPAPARISACSAGSVTAARCSGLRFGSSGESAATSGNMGIVESRAAPK
jgi:hypothetical protein